MGNKVICNIKDKNFNLKEIKVFDSKSELKDYLSNSLDNIEVSDWLKKKDEDHKYNDISFKSDRLDGDIIICKIKRDQKEFDALINPYTSEMIHKVVEPKE